MSSIKIERIKQTFKKQVEAGNTILYYNDYGIRIEFKADCFMAFGLSNKEEQELYKFCKEILAQ